MQLPQKSTPEVGFCPAFTHFGCDSRQSDFGWTPFPGPSLVPILRRLEVLQLCLQRVVQLQAAREGHLPESQYRRGPGAIMGDSQRAKVPILMLESQRNSRAQDLPRADVKSWRVFM
jgi:hypothetical protein